VQCKGCRRRFEVPADGIEVLHPNGDEDNATADKADSEDQLLSDTDQLLRNVLLWHCVVRILTWQQLTPGSGLPENERKTLHRRLQQVIKVDASMGDPYLIDGLIDYYFARNDQERRRGREQIERSLKKDVHLPEILQLIEREQKLASLSENSLSYFHQLSRKYIENPEVDPQLRERFAQKMNRFERFRSMGVVGEETQASVVPSLENLRGRGQILSTRVTNILRYRMSDASEELRGQIGERLGQMQERTKVLSETADSLQKTEFELMEHTGEFLFNDDVPASGDTGRERSSQQ
jgi:hypothetical protein